MTEEEAIKLCSSKGLRKSAVPIVIDYFINDLSHKEIAVKYSIEESSSLKKKYRLKKKLWG